MCVEHFQRFNVRSDHGDDTALLLAFQLCRTEHAERTENLIAQHRQQFKCDIMVGILFQIPQSATDDTAANGKPYYPAPREGNFGAQAQNSERLCNARCARDRNAHCRDKPDRAIDDGKDHDIRQRTEQDDEARHDLCAASAKFCLHTLTSL